MFKKVLIGIAGGIVLMALIGFALPSTLNVSDSISINVPIDVVFEEVNEVQNWSSWSYWQAQDPSMKITYGDVTAGDGAGYSWTSKDGNGSLIFTESIADKSIKFDLFFMEDGSPAKGWYAFEPEGEGTKLSCGFTSDYGLNPLMRWIGLLVIEPEMKKAFTHELGKLKQLAEANANVNEETDTN